MPEIDFYVTQTKSSVHGNKIIVIYLSMILSIHFSTFTLLLRTHARRQEGTHAETGQKLCVCVCMSHECLFIVQAVNINVQPFSLLKIYVMVFTSANNGVKTDTLANNNNNNIKSK